MSLAGVPRRAAASSAVGFFVLTFVLTTPFWLLSWRSGSLLMPGLPIAAFAVICPAISALALAGSQHRSQWLAAVARRLDPRPLANWRILYALLPVGPAIGAFLLLRAGGAAVPDPVFVPGAVLGLFGLFLTAAIAEELGWTGFALDRLQVRHGPLAAAAIIGVVWSAWHWPALFQVGRDLTWIAWWTLGTIGLRVLITWLACETGGSVLAASLMHAVSNLCWQTFPVQGSWFDPRLNALFMGALSGVGAICLICADGRFRRAARRRLSPSSDR